MAMNDAEHRPLAGIRALELAEVWAGPFCGALLGDMGADVIKIESVQRIGRGPIRPRDGNPNYPDGEPGERPWNRGANFNGVNRNKLGITLDLTSPKGVDAFLDLVNLSDLVFSNYKFGVLDSFGIGYDTLRRVRPDIIMLEMPGYGNTGPYREYRSMGMTLDAIMGHSSLRGYPDLDRSFLTPVHHPDAVGGVTGVFAACAALHHRARTGHGQLIDLAQSETFISHIGEAFLEYGMTGRVRGPRGNRHPAMAPHGCYPCLGDDKWVTIAVRDEDEWEAFCRALGMPELAADRRFATLEARLENQDELDALIGRWTASQDRYEATRHLQGYGIPAGPVLEAGGDIYDDPHLQEREYFQFVDHPDAGPHLLSGPIWKMSGAPEPLNNPTPSLGQDNERVLGRLLGLPDEVLQGLEEENIIGTVPLEGADLGGVRRLANRT